MDTAKKYGLSYEQIQHIWNILNGYPHQSAYSMTKLNKVFAVLRPHVKILSDFINASLWDLNLAKEKKNDVFKTVDSKAEDRVQLERAYEDAKKVAQEKIDEFKTKQIDVSFDRESIAYAKELYTKFIPMNYSKDDKGVENGVGSENDVRLFSEVIEALEIIVPKD